MLGMNDEDPGRTSVLVSSLRYVMCIGSLVDGVASTMPPAKSNLVVAVEPKLNSG